MWRTEATVSYDSNVVLLAEVDQAMLVKIWMYLYL